MMARLWKRARAAHKELLVSWLPTLLTLGCAVAVAVLCEHHCTGDECHLCLVLQGMQVLLCLSAGVTVACPLMAFVVMAATCSPLGIPVLALAKPALRCVAPCVVQTPVSNKVKLLI